MRVNDSSVQRGQVGQPRPEPVRRTAPPVSTMPMLATRVAQPSRRSQGGRRRPPAPQAHSHLNVLAVRRAPMPVQTSSTSMDSTRRRRTRTPTGARRREPGGQQLGDAPKPPYAEDREHDGPAHHQQQVDEVRRSQRGLRAEHASDEQAQRGERSRAGSTISIAAGSEACGCQSRANATRRSPAICSTSTEGGRRPCRAAARTAATVRTRAA